MSLFFSCVSMVTVSAYPTVAHLWGNADSERAIAIWLVKAATERTSRLIFQTSIELPQEILRISTCAALTEGCRRL